MLCLRGREKVRGRCLKEDITGQFRSSLNPKPCSKVSRASQEFQPCSSHTLVVGSLWGGQAQVTKHLEGHPSHLNWIGGVWVPCLKRIRFSS